MSIFSILGIILGSSILLSLPTVVDSFGVSLSRIIRISYTTCLHDRGANTDDHDDTTSDKTGMVSDQNSVEIPIFDAIAKSAVDCIYRSDLTIDAIGSSIQRRRTTPSSATNWIDEDGAANLQISLNKLHISDDIKSNDILVSYMRWFRSLPTAAVVDLSQQFHQSVNATLDCQNNSIRDFTNSTTTDDDIDVLQRVDVNRLTCRLILLPSGGKLNSPLTEPAASVTYGKLLYGGVTRFRQLGTSIQSQRRAGVRTEVKPKISDTIQPWMMYGGPGRSYEAIDMGPAAILEVVLLPKGKSVMRDVCVGTKNMRIGRIAWRPQEMFGYFDSDNDDDSNAQSSTTTAMFASTVSSSLSGRDRNDAFRADFSTSLGGLQSQIDAIVRRVLDGRVIRPADDDDGAQTGTSTRVGAVTETALEAEELALLGLSPVRGLLLYGPPGCGKTALAREISRVLRARTPKVVSAPELLDRWVGGSEKLVRLLFVDAEAELAACNGDATKSALHVVVIDEIDAVFRKRSSSEDSGEATRSSVVNQILAKLDGVNAIPNLLFIGMTNRRELLDEALLRPGRLEVQIEIPLPDENGRREILKIHFDALRKRGRLSQNLCTAIDGPAGRNDVDSGDDTKHGEHTKKKGKRQRLSNFFLPTNIGRQHYDLAATPTVGFSGADIAGLVRCAGSLALSRSRQDGNGIDGLAITLEDVKRALLEVKR